MPQIIDAALDAALNYVRTNATELHVCSAEPTSFPNVSTVSLGNKSAPSIAAPAPGTPDGRSITVSAISDGNVTANGTGTHWALVSGSQLLAAGNLASSQALTNGNTLTLTAFAFTARDAVSAP